MDVFEGPITEDLGEGLVVDGHDEVGAAQGEVFGPLECVGDGEGLAFHGGVPGCVNREPTRVILHPVWQQKRSSEGR